jgi:hypothetical protein
VTHDAFRVRTLSQLLHLEERVLMVATAAFIDRGDLKDTFAIATRSSAHGKSRYPSQQSLLPLSWLNFFLAGMQTAFGPIAAAYLAA